ncbi:MAG TPA: DUF4416 family protein [Nitrospinota bacterium]|nr:DUF4416 family protein [Nitrospinota bacterium]
MGKIKYPFPVKLIVGLIFKDEEVLRMTKEKLIKRLGKMDFESQLISFNFTTYYEKEMGEGLKRQFLSFEPLMKIENLPKIKIETNEVEKEFNFPNTPNRMVNIDPGYVAPEKLILATTKNYDHRPYLDNGIYAELTYRFYKGSFRTFEWTYPDYKSPESIEIFNEIRKIYMKQLRAAQQKECITQ